MLKRKQRVVLEVWLQEHVNSWYYNEPCLERCAATKLTLPPLGSVIVGDMSVLSISAQEDVLLEGKACGCRGISVVSLYIASTPCQNVE